MLPLGYICSINSLLTVGDSLRQAVFLSVEEPLTMFKQKSIQIVVLQKMNLVPMNMRRGKKNSF